MKTERDPEQKPLEQEVERLNRQGKDAAGKIICDKELRLCELCLRERPLTRKLEAEDETFVLRSSHNSASCKGHGGREHSKNFKKRAEANQTPKIVAATLRIIASRKRI
uniref:Uncharacterized protein n=1 Tax=Loa loa TaxID=7209 RepID=A0A1I7W5X1_LOALO